MEQDKRNKNTPAENFGRNLQTYLKARGITQKELAEKIGTGTNVVNAWVQGRRSPSLHWLCKIRDILNVSFEELLIGPDSERKFQDLVEDHYLSFYKYLFPNEPHITLPDNYKQLVNAVLSLALKPREKDIIIDRFGLNGEIQASCSNLSEKYGVSRQRISQIVLKSCVILRECRQYLLPSQPQTETSLDIFMRFLADLRAEYPYKIQGDYDTYDRYNMAWNDCLDRVESWIDSQIKEEKEGVCS